MKMKHLVIIYVVLAAAKIDAQIMFDTKNLENGEYSYSYYGVLYSKDETGKLDDEGNSVVTGEYRYVVGDKEYYVTYTADKDGFHPKVTISDFNILPPGQSVGTEFAAPPHIVASLLGK